MTSNNKPLDQIFQLTPDSFLEEGLREYVEYFNPKLKTKNDSPPQKNSEPTIDEEEEHTQFQGKDTWKKKALTYVQELRWGTCSDMEAVWGHEAPAELSALEHAVDGANPWTTFNEFRLSEGMLINPSEDKNLFEMVVLLDQLSYLGTGLGEVCSGVVGLASLGNGDTYHYDVHTTLLAVGSIESRSIHFWDHDSHAFDFVFADSLSSLLFLVSLTHAVDEDVISKVVAQKGFEQLRGKVSPSWHFSIEGYDEGFERLESESSIAGYYYWRSAWIQYFLRSNGIVNVENLGDYFVEALNQPLTEEDFVARLEGIGTYVHTAVYSMWKAYLFDEPELETILLASEKHKGRMARDCASLIREFQNGRKDLGRISDMAEHIARFRALDLDPRRASDRVAEVEAEEQAAVEEMKILFLELDGLASSELEAFAWQHFDSTAVVPIQKSWIGMFDNLSWSLGLETTQLRAKVLQRLIEDDPEAKRGVEFLSQNGDLDALGKEDINWGLGDITPGQQAVLLADCLHNNGRGIFSSHQAARILTEVARCGNLDPRILPPLRDQFQLGPDGRPDVKLTSILSILGQAKDGNCLAILEAVLGKIPHEGDWETTMHFDSFVAAIAITIEKIGDAISSKILLRFAGSQSFRESVVACGYTIAKLAPETGLEIAENILKQIADVNDPDENSRCVIAFAIIAASQDKNKSKALAMLENTRPMANYYPEVKLAMAAASLLLGGSDTYAGSCLSNLLVSCFEEKADSKKRTIKRRRWALEIHGIFPDFVNLENYIEELVALKNPDIDEQLKNLGVEAFYFF